MAQVFTSNPAKATILYFVILALASIKTVAANSGGIGGVDIWKNPCANRPIRHIKRRSTAEKELSFFINTLDKVMFPKLRKLYPKNQKKVNGNCPRLRRLIEPIETASSTNLAHERFYTSMYELYNILERLQNINVNTTHVFDNRKRVKLYKKTKNTLQLTICEFQESMRKELNTPGAFFEKKPPVTSTKCLPKSADLTRLQTLDLQFFKKLKKFFRQGRQLLRKTKMNGKSSKAKNLRTNSV